MQTESKLQPWGNSTGIRLSTKILEAAGLERDSVVEIQAQDGRVVIQRTGTTLEQELDALLADEPEAAEVMQLVKRALSDAIEQTDETTERCYSLIEKLDQREMF